VSLLVDTSVWSLLLRRNDRHETPEVGALKKALGGDDLVVSTGIILQEILQGAVPPKARRAILESFAYVPMKTPSREDHVAAAELRNTCRYGGVQLGTVDALIAQLAIRDDDELLTADRDFHHAAAHVPLRLWSADRP
jgi:predicted nucleic acid-binding protein